MTSGAECSLALTRLIHRTLIAVMNIQINNLDWLDKNYRHAVIQDFRMLLGQVAELPVPASAVQEEAVDVGAIVRLLLDVVFGNDVELKREQIDGNGVLSGKVLFDTCVINEKLIINNGKSSCVHLI